MVDRISTGIDPLDRQLQGGIREGNTVALVAPPASQSESILTTFARQRPTLYISTIRSEASVQGVLDRNNVPLDQVEITDVGVATPMDSAIREIEKIDEPVNVILDSVNPLEEEEQRKRYVNLLNKIQNHLVNTQSVMMVHCTGLDAPTDHRNYTLTFADQVWELEVRTSGTVLQNRLKVPKLRGEEMVEDVITVKLGRRVSVDMSRDIA